MVCTIFAEEDFGQGIVDALLGEEFSGGGEEPPTGGWATGRERFEQDALSGHGLEAENVRFVVWVEFTRQLEGQLGGVGEIEQPKAITARARAEAADHHGVGAGGSQA